MKKYLIISIILILSCLAAAGLFIFNKISSLSVKDIETLASNRLGAKVSIASIHPELSWANIVMVLTDVSIKDKNTNEHIFSSERIESKFNIWKTITKQEGIKIRLENSVCSDSNIFTGKIEIPLIKGGIYWKTISNKLALEFKNFKVTLPETKIKFDLTANYKNKTFTIIEFKANTTQIDVISAHKYVPYKILPKELSEWISTSIKSGTILSNFLIVNNETFDLKMNFKDALLEYDSEWPALKDLCGNIHLTEKKIIITGTSGKILDAEIKNTVATIDGLDQSESFPLIVDGTVNGTLEQGLQFLLSGPLNHIGNILKNYQPTGIMNLGLNFSTPIIKTEALPTKINGTLDINDGILTDSELNITLNNIKGLINFTENKIYASDVSANFLGNTATATINYDEDKSKLLEVSLNTQLKSQEIIDSFPILNSINISGDSNFDIKIYIPMDNTSTKQTIISSNLLGLNINLPHPLGKKENKKRLFDLHVFNYKDPLKLDVSYGKQIKVEFVSNGSNSGEVFIKGNLKNCNMQDWLDFTSNNNIPIKIPVKLDLSIENLKLLDSIFKDIHLFYNTANKELKLNSNDLSGSVISSNKNEPSIHADFNKIVINNIPETKEKIKKLTPGNLTKLVFNCKNLFLNSESPMEVIFTLEPKNYGYNISNLKINENDFSLSGHGKWNMLNTNNTELSANITSKNFGKVFDLWGLGKSITNGSGKMSMNFKWNGEPMDFKLENLKEGDVNFDIKSGTIKGIDPGFGRIIGLLSLDSIQRRLKLDFSDVVDKGFAFDKLQADFKIHDGFLHSDGIFIDGPSAYVALTGDANIKTKEIDFKMGVVPKVEAGLPLAAAITAGNPAIGAALWIFNKAASKSNMKNKEIPRYKYKVTGTWAEPKISEINGGS